MINYVVKCLLFLTQNDWKKQCHFTDLRSNLLNIKNRQKRLRIAINLTNLHRILSRKNELFNALWVTLRRIDIIWARELVISGSCRCLVDGRFGVVRIEFANTFTCGCASRCIQFVRIINRAVFITIPIAGISSTPIEFNKSWIHSQRVTVTSPWQSPARLVLLSFVQQICRTNPNPL